MDVLPYSMFFCLTFGWFVGCFVFFFSPLAGGSFFDKSMELRLLSLQWKNIKTKAGGWKSFAPNNGTSFSFSWVFLFSTISICCLLPWHCFDKTKKQTPSSLHVLHCLRCVNYKRAQYYLHTPHHTWPEITTSNKCSLVFCHVSKMSSWDRQQKIHGSVFILWTQHTLETKTAETRLEAAWTGLPLTTLPDVLYGLSRGLPPELSRDIPGNLTPGVAVWLVLPLVLVLVVLVVVS